MVEVQSVEVLARVWWLLALRGALAFLLAAASLYAANAMIGRLGEALALVFFVGCVGVYLVAAAALEIWLALLVMPRVHWWICLAQPAVLLAVAGKLLTSPRNNLALIVWLVIFHAAFTAWMELASALHLRRHRLQADLLAGAALLSAAVALAVFLFRDSAHRLVMVIAVYAALLAACLVVNALQLRTLARRHQSAAAPA